jgi:hypothetical protein
MDLINSQFFPNYQIHPDFANIIYKYFKDCKASIIIHSYMSMNKIARYFIIFLKIIDALKDWIE